MDILTTIQQRSSERNLQFIVVGGLAIIAHGYERVTFDIDILVRQEERAAWKELMLSLGYKIFHEQVPFMQFHASENSIWPVDLMFANEQTFSQIFHESLKIPLKGKMFRFPTLGHLIALKVHTLKHTNANRLSNDLLDVISIMEMNQFECGSELVRELCDRYGVFETKPIRAFEDERPATAVPFKVDLDLELPDGTGFQSKYVRVGLDAMVSLCEERLEMFISRPGAEERRLRDKCNVEFVL